MLSSLSTQTWPRIEKYRFRLGGALSAVPSLRRLSVRVLERSLTDQLLGAFNPKLRRLEVTGPDLHDAAGDAFEGIEDHQELALQVGVVPCRVRWGRRGWSRSGPGRYIRN